MMMKKLAFLLWTCWLQLAVAAQSEAWYNWSGFPLRIYAGPSEKGKVVEAIPAGGAVTVLPGTNEPVYTIYLSYYGDTSTLKNEAIGEINNSGSFYPLKTPWVKVQTANNTGFVPLGFLSRIPPKALYQKKEGDQEISLLKAMKVYYGKPLSYKKQELEKESKEEIHFVEHYQFPGKVTYTVTQQYAEKDGPGGEEHRIFLPHTALHEAVLFLLKITDATAYRPEKRTSVNRIKSLYDFFSWWYQPEQYEEEDDSSVNDKNRIGFEYYAEGGSGNVKFIVKDQGVEIVYAYGGC